MDASSSRLDAELAYLPAVNLALQQNALPFVQELKLKNGPGKELSELECAFSSTSDIIEPKAVHASLLRPGEELALHDLGLELNVKTLVSLSDALRGKLFLDVKDGTGAALLHKEFPLTAYAADQWLGAEAVPELLAAFVTPNMEVIASLMGVVAKELESATKSSAIEGYQKDKTRVYDICAAIYRAIHSWGITYANPPASFGSAGQRVRFADAMYKYKLGTCLDTTLLFASVMEQCGLHPVIMLQKGHSYIGCHLVDRYFSDLPMDDLQAIRKLVELDEFLVCETTLATGDSTFAEAEAAARAKHLNIDDDFRYAIDIVRARYSGIRPLPLKRTTDGIEIEASDHVASALGAERNRPLQKEIALEDLQAGKGDKDRVARWKQKLLDLSLRNRLLNVRDTKQVVPLACASILALEDKLAADESLTVNPLSNLLGEKDQHDLSMLRATEIKDETRALLDKELTQKRLWASLTPQELKRRMTGLYRQSRTDIEEGGVNTLFLALGFLEWKVSERDSKSYLAPILLMPVKLQRPSMAQGITLSRWDDDTVINVTLLELLRREHNITIPGLDPLPTDDSGVDVARVIQIFRQATKDMKGWEVREEAKLGLFSFNKFIMWNDLTNRLESLQKHPLVSHLISGGGMFNDGIDVFPPAELSKHLDLPNLYCPMSADSSQLAAVIYSQMGKSFVLHGPPGTGKSQTITNIIAHNLALGRRVLFVSEKKAALDVVHHRLTSIGLKPFCLELHSNKSGKAEVLAQFSEALAVADTPSPQDWGSTIAELQRLRDELNGYIAALHHAYPNGITPYDCFSRLMGATEEKFGGLKSLDCLRQTRDDFNAMARRLSETATAFANTTAESRKALLPLKPMDWTPQAERELSDTAKAYLDASEALAAAYRAAAGVLGLSPGNNGLAAIASAAALADTLKKAGDIPADLLTPAIAERHDFIDAFAKNAVGLGICRDKLAGCRLETAREMDCNGIEKRISENNGKFVLNRVFANRSLLKELSGLKKLGSGDLSVEELSSLLPSIREYQARQADYDKDAAQASQLLGTAWNSGSPDWPRLAPLLEKAAQIHADVLAVTDGDKAQQQQALASLQGILPNGVAHFAEGTAPRALLDTLTDVYGTFSEKQRAFARYIPDGPRPDTIAGLSDSLRGRLAHMNDLRGVLMYLKGRTSIEADGFAALINAMEDGALAPDKVEAAFEAAYCREMLNQVITATPVLRDFIGLTEDERSRKFCEMDDRYIALSRKAVFAKLAANLPRRRTGPCPEGTELGLLKRECEKRQRQKPVRLLLEQIPTLLQTLKPCFLMSPLSVAQYLPPDSAQFDLVVFDEASQIPVWDAVGVIARGKQLVVVGDPMQMPPTSFFQKGDSGDEDADITPDAPLEDMESILDECLAAGVYSSYLNWHYRSRHESLIAFSNHEYYHDRLSTFPSAKNSDDLGVRFVYVPDAVYDRTASRTNRTEAKALIDYIFERLKDPRFLKKSVGVVTFSQAQKDLIEDVVEETRSRHPEFEAFFSEDSEEPFFVKNLENVQGDERDVILFSVGYAKDPSGKFAMNFGPLNQEGGERRLNVAITRAKEQIIVFSSVHAYQIDLGRTSSTGAAHLKYFLDYAEKGISYQSADTGAHSPAKADGTCDSIAAFLAAKGFKVARNVGSSDCKIDVAVTNPGKADEYLLGIECDGPAYAKQLTARDREHVRPGVLHSLGWHLFRAWSMDWSFDRAHAEARLLAAIEAAKLPDPPKPAAPSPAPASAKGTPVPPPIPAVEKSVYREWATKASLTPKMFSDGHSRLTIEAQFQEVLSAESPICESLLRWRVMKAWGISRATANVNAILDTCVPTEPMCRITRLGDENVYWTSGSDPAAYSGYRVPGPDGDRRDIAEIPPEELANAMEQILMDFQSCGTDVLYRETVKLFGFAALTAKMRAALDKALEVVQSRGRVPLA
jgi:hypothetical protein